MNDSNFIVRANNVEHAYNHHGNENRIGQIDVTPDNYSKIKETIGKPDYLGLSDENTNGNPTIYFAKKINGYSVAVEVVKEKSKQIYPQTYYVFSSDSKEWYDFIKNNKLKGTEAVRLDESADSPKVNVQDDTVEVPFVNNIIPSKNNYVKSSGDSKIAPTAEDLKKSMIDNSSKEAQEILNSDKIEVKQGRTNSKVVSNDDNIQVSRSGNIYPEGNKITAKEYVTTGADEHYKKGDTRFIPIDSKHADKGYVTQKWDGEKWIDADEYSDFDKLLEDNGRCIPL